MGKKVRRGIKKRERKRKKSATWKPHLGSNLAGSSHWLFPNILWLCNLKKKKKIGALH
jgi:hypothetical protein